MLKSMAERNFLTIFMCILALLKECNLVQGMGTSPDMMCNRIPKIPMAKDAMRGDDGFEIRVQYPYSRTMAEEFDPGEMYDVIVTNRRFNVMFVDFYLTAVAEGTPMEMEKFSDHQGSFTHMISPTQDVPGCPWQVKGRSLFFRRAEVQWRAPIRPMKCVEFRATIVRQHGLYLKDIGKLLKKICPTAMHSMEIVDMSDEEMMKMQKESEMMEKDMNKKDDMMQKGDGEMRMEKDMNKKGDMMKKEKKEKIMKKEMKMKNNGEKYKEMKMPMKMGPARKMPPMIKECCACGVATYNLTFTSLWTKEHHPKDWPMQGNLLHWTNLIGATHDANYMIYYLGGQASIGVQSVCTYGDPTPLTQELTGEKGLKHILNLIQAPGMWGENEMNQSRSTLISVNRTFHLLSFLTMMGPSPDWCSGIASLDLCRKDCAWKSNLTIDLYAWDAGVRYGDTYMPKNADRLDYPEPIREITNDWPKGNPLTAGRPVARLTLERKRPEKDSDCVPDALPGVVDPRSPSVRKDLGNGVSGGAGLKKNRRGSQSSPLDDPVLADMAKFLCITSEWVQWTRCSVTCGVGVRSRERLMIENKKNELCRHVPLMETEQCEGRKRTCDFSAKCSMLSWSEWSPCSATCETGGTTWRSRMFARPSEKEECQNYYETREEKTCTKSPSECDKISICSETPLKEGYTCGKPQTRYSYEAASHSCKSFSYKGCKGSKNNFKTMVLCEETCIEAVSAMPPWRRDRLVTLQNQELMRQNRRKGKRRGKGKGKKGKMDESMVMASWCMKPMDPGYICDSNMKPNEMETKTDTIVTKPMMMNSPTAVKPDGSKKYNDMSQMTTMMMDNKMPNSKMNNSKQNMKQMTLTMDENNMMDMKFRQKLDNMVEGPMMEKSRTTMMPQIKMEGKYASNENNMMTTMERKMSTMKPMMVMRNSDENDDTMEQPMMKEKKDDGWNEK